MYLGWLHRNPEAMLYGPEDSTLIARVRSRWDYHYASKNRRGLNCAGPEML